MWGYKQNLALIGQVVWKMKMFDTVGRQMHAGAWVYYKLTYEPSAQASLKGFSWCVSFIHVYSTYWPSTSEDEDV